MPRHAPPAARCRLFTYKEGLLSKVAHDLELAVEDFEVRWEGAGEPDGEAVRATFRADSIRVLHALRDGRPNPRALSARDHRKIEDSIRGEVLDTRRYPEVRFRSTAIRPAGDGRWDLRGELSIRGRARPVSGTARREGDRLVAAFRLDQRDWGIRPFTALMGALKIQPHVDVRLEIPAP